MNWETAEETVLRVIQKYFPNARLTSGSGNQHGDGDIGNILGVHIDVKDAQRTTSLTVTKQDLEHTIHQAIQRGREWVVVSRTKDGKLIASCDLNLLFCLLEMAPKGYFG